MSFLIGHRAKNGEAIYFQEYLDREQSLWTPKEEEAYRFEGSINAQHYAFTVLELNTDTAFLFQVV